MFLSIISVTQKKIAVENPNLVLNIFVSHADTFYKDLINSLRSGHTKEF